MIAEVDPREIDHAVLLGDLDPLADARRLTLDDGGQNSDRGMQAGARVAETGLDAHGGPSGLPVRLMTAAHGLSDHLEAVIGRVGALTAEPLDRRRDDARVEAGQRLVPKPETLHRAGAEVLDHDVGLLDHVLEHLAAARGFEIERHAPLVRVHQTEEDRVHVGPLTEPTARSLTRRWLDLDDLGAEPGQGLGAAWSCFVLGEVENADTVERFRHRSLLLADVSSNRPSARM